MKELKAVALKYPENAEAPFISAVGKGLAAEKILEIAKSQQMRGADIAKIVTTVNSEKELEDAFKTNLILRDNLNIPFLFLCNGSYCRKHRMLGPFLGSCMYLCQENSKTCGPQPTIEEAKLLIGVKGSNCAVIRKDDYYGNNAGKRSPTLAIPCAASTGICQFAAK